MDAQRVEVGNFGSRSTENHVIVNFILRGFPVTKSVTIVCTLIACRMWATASQDRSEAEDLSKAITESVTIVCTLIISYHTIMLPSRYSLISYQVSKRRTSSACFT